MCHVQVEASALEPEFMQRIFAHAIPGNRPRPRSTVHGRNGIEARRRSVMRAGLFVPAQATSKHVSETKRKADMLCDVARTHSRRHRLHAPLDTHPRLMHAS
jgi:hypothetical protein